MAHGASCTSLCCSVPAQAVFSAFTLTIQWPTASVVVHVVALVATTLVPYVTLLIPSVVVIIIIDLLTQSQCPTNPAITRLHPNSAFPHHCHSNYPFTHLHHHFNSSMHSHFQSSPDLETTAHFVERVASKDPGLYESFLPATAHSQHSIHEYFV
jgi:hypothetical protein